MSEKKVLIVEDDPEAQEILRRYLEPEGYELLLAADGREGLKLAKGHNPDLMVLDVNLPQMNGFDVLRELHQESSYCPVIIVTAYQDDTDKVVGLELGADDYLTKPFNPRELIARIRALLRRVEMASQKKQEKEKVRVGDVELDLAAQTCAVGDKRYALTLTEYSLLRLLMQNAGRVLSREQILDRVWGNEFAGELRVVDVHIRNLRKKLTEGLPNRQFIQSVRGVGYKFEE